MWTLLELFIWIIFLYRSFVRWRAGHLFSSLSLKFLAINSCFVGIIVRNFYMVSRLYRSGHWIDRFSLFSRGWSVQTCDAIPRARVRPALDTPLTARIVSRVASNVAI
jgi:hypothetical protein